ncbi:MAG: biotin transporter BioY [Clostridia bacterium]|nr:biotin transporter BioY [Clostridia bacterium]
MKINTKALCITALFTALICVLSPLSFPTPFGVPVTFQTLIIALAAFLLGTKNALAAVICYILIGAAGLPVFSGFSAGTAALVSPTGGFIFAFPLFALLLSLMFYVNKAAAKIILAVCALLSLYLAGAIQFMIITGGSALAAAGAFSLYFIKDAAVILAAYFLCVRIRPGIRKFIQP